MADFLLPDVGEGLTEAEIVSWHVKVGDTVAVNDVLVDIETAKSIVELPSPFAGVVTAVLVAEGETVHVGTPIVTIDAAMPELDLTNPSGSGLREGESLVGRSKEPSVARRRSHRRAQTEGRSRTGGSSAPEGRSPVGRSSAPEGRVSRPSEFEALPGDHREPIKGVRKAMGEAMVKSAFTAPHVTTWLEVDVTESVALLADWRARPEFSEARPSFLLLTALATAAAVRRSPIVNSTWDDDAGEVVLHADLNLGIAVATDRGLLVPVVRSVHGRSARDLNQALREAIDQAREGRTPPTEMSGGTFTITDIGPLGVDGGTPIINPGQSAILCVGAVHRRPWVVDTHGEERLAIRDVCTLALSFDHRHIDGAAGSKFLADVAAGLRHPAELS